MIRVKRRCPNTNTFGAAATEWATETGSIYSRLGQEARHLCLLKASTPALKTSQRRIKRTPADFCRDVKRPEPEAYYSPLPAKVKNECGYICSRPRHLQGVHSGDCTLILTDEAELSRNCCEVRICYVVIKCNTRDWLYFTWALQPE